MDERAVDASSKLYESDFYSWTQEQARLLRSGQLDALDVANIIEEIETRGRSERASLKSAYRLICSHLLKMMVQPEKRTRSWHDTIDRERGEVGDILSENPGLRPMRDDIFAKAYALARKDAARETRIPLARFPDTPPFTREACEDPAYWPPATPARGAGKSRARKTGA